jgi:ribonuclease BN (tRNA processing enzyme)
MSPPYFPVDIRQLPSRRTYHTISDGQSVIWQHGSDEPVVCEWFASHLHMKETTDLRVVAKFTNNHPLNGVLSYRIEYAGRSLVYATDVEWSNGCDPEFLAFVKGAHLLIHDAQYSAYDYQTKHGFGHSTVEMAADTAHAAHVNELILFHHEPTYDDKQLDLMEAEAQTCFARTHSAYEGMEIDLLTSIRIE